jgi:cyclin-dependent kinase
LILCIEELCIADRRLRSLLGTPFEDIWPGVTSYPDFKSSFPKWSRNQEAALCSNLDDAGLDLLEMMLVYDPAGRISAKQACNHPFFEDYPRSDGYMNGYSS